MLPQGPERDDSVQDLHLFLLSQSPERSSQSSGRFTNKGIHQRRDLDPGSTQYFGLSFNIWLLDQMQSIWPSIRGILSWKQHHYPPWACCSGWYHGRQIYRGPCQTPQWPPRFWARRTWSCSEPDGALMQTSLRGTTPPAISAVYGSSSLLNSRMNTADGDIESERERDCRCCFFSFISSLEWKTN